MTILRRYVELDGRRISCLTAGDPASGTPLLLIHGSGVSAGYWVNQLLGLRDAFRVMAIDLPGHGKSDPIPNASVETYADTVAKFLTAVIPRPVMVAGHSLGGAVAMRSEEHTSELQSPCNLVCRLLLEKKKKKNHTND